VEELSLILADEREALERLQFALETERLVLASGRTRWLMRAAKGVEDVLEELRAVEVMRAVAADQAAEALGLPSNPSLQALAEAADEPWRTILLDHHSAFVSTVHEVTDLAENNRELITSGYTSARETLLALGKGAEGYSPDGTAAVIASTPHRLVDRTL
jgi:hypothetical protein